MNRKDPADYQQVIATIVHGVFLAHQCCEAAFEPGGAVILNEPVWRWLRFLPRARKVGREGLLLLSQKAHAEALGLRHQLREAAQFVRAEQYLGRLQGQRAYRVGRHGVHTFVDSNGDHADAASEAAKYIAECTRVDHESA